MAEFSDEMLMAYADGELAPAERREVEAAIVANPELRSRLSIFERTKDELSILFDEPMRRPLPDRLVDAVFGVSADADGGVERSRLSFNVKSALAGVFAALLSRERMAFAIPAIVCLLVFAGGLSGWHLRSIGGQPTPAGSPAVAAGQPPLAILEHGRVVAQAHLRQALEIVSASPHRIARHMQGPLHIETGLTNWEMASRGGGDAKPASLRGEARRRRDLALVADELSADFIDLDQRLLKFDGS